MEPYKVTKAFGPDGEIGLKEALSTYIIYDNKGKELEVGKDYKYYLPRILSIVPHDREVCDVKVSVPSNVKPKIQVYNDGKAPYQVDLSITESLQIAQKLLPLVADFRAEDFNDWMNIGWTLYNIG